jgi:hypothetical protein
MKRLVLALSVLAARPLGVQAGSAGEAAFAFLTVTPFARSAGMAEATSAYVGEPLAVYSNPAGLAHLGMHHLSAHHGSHFQDVSYNNLTWIGPYRQGGVGVNVGMLSIADIPRTTFDPARTDRFVESGEVEAGDLAATFSWGHRYDRRLAVGANLKAARETLDAESAVSVMADAGVIYRSPFRRKWRLAGVLQNLGTPAKFTSASVRPPTRVRAGVLNQFRPWGLWSAELVQGLGQDPTLLAGGEFSWERKGFARVGYRHHFRPTDLGLTAGVTLGLGWQAEQFDMEYAFLPFGDLGSSHFVSLSWKWRSSKVPKPDPEPARKSIRKYRR